MGRQHLAGAGHLEALFRARFGLQLGHLALLYGPDTRAKGPVHRHMLEMSVCFEALSHRHGSPLAGRRKAGFMADKMRENNRVGGRFSPVLAVIGGTAAPTAQEFVNQSVARSALRQHARSGTGPRTKGLSRRPSN